ncbi:hypothetical protein IFM89_006756 [Coptis chinensis]|uniref:Uncharacterized protein n=1 Tax=Coptis chinensis TaxID=261450 RepID=A0A835HTP2_9MAGN|nr:hypothetical protein IFM89_006756 [Coptis chinensis]
MRALPPSGLSFIPRSPSQFPFQLSLVLSSISRAYIFVPCGDFLDSTSLALVCNVNARSFFPENPIIIVCQTLLDNSRTSHDKLNVSGSFNLPSLDDNGLRQAIFSRTDGTTSAPKETNYMFGFQYMEYGHIRSNNDIKALELMYPFPTLLPHFQATPLPVVIIQECLLFYIKKQDQVFPAHLEPLYGLSHVILLQRMLT